MLRDSLEGTRMANKTVSIYKQVKIGNKWKKVPPYINPKNNRVENDKVLVAGKVEVHPEGDWGLYYYVNNKRQWKLIGPKYETAKRAAEAKRAALNAKAQGHEVVEKGED